MDPNQIMAPEAPIADPGMGAGAPMEAPMDVPMDMPGEGVPTEPIPADAPEASIPDEPGMPVEGEAPPVEGDAEGAMGDLPTDQGQWEETTIMEGVGSGEEHQDPFWRYENWGIEADTDGKYEAYAIVDETPMMIEGGFESFEEAVMYLNQNINKKKLGSSEEAPSEEEVAEETATESPDVEEEPAEEAPAKEAPAEKEDKPEKDDKPEDKPEKKDDEKEEKKDDDKKESKPAKKSASGADPDGSIRNMMGAYWSQRTRGVANLPRTGVSMREIAKSKNPTVAVGGVRVRIGYDKDEIDMMPGKEKHDKKNEGGMKHISPSVRNAMAPPSHGGKANLKAPCTDDIYDETSMGHASTGVKSVDNIY